MKPLKLIALLLFVGGATWALTRSEPTVREIQTAYYRVISPFVKAGTALDVRARDFFSEVKHSKQLAAELQTVKAQLGRMPIIESRCRELEKENAALLHALGFKKDVKEGVGFDVQAAQIIRRNPATWWQTVEIDAGSRSGVHVKLAVLSNQGLVGVIDRVLGEDRSSVLLLTDEACQVSAKVEESPEVGILSGQRGLGEGTPMLRLRFISKEALLHPGQRVFTTGRGGIFKANILLGTIVSVEKGAADSEALVKPAVNFADLGTVFVVRDQPAPPL